MPGQRRELQTILEAILGSANVYFQPPPNIRLAYPCIVYKRDYSFENHADNTKYHHQKRYQVVVIDRNPDSEFPDKVGVLPMCRYDRFYAADGLNHDVFNLYF